MSAHGGEEVLVGLARKILLLRPLDTPCLRIDGQVSSFTVASIVKDNAGFARRTFRNVILWRSRILTGGLTTGGVRLSILIKFLGDVNVVILWTSFDLFQSCVRHFIPNSNKCLSVVRPSSVSCVFPRYSRTSHLHFDRCSDSILRTSCTFFGTTTSSKLESPVPVPYRNQFCMEQAPAIPFEKLSTYHYWYNKSSSRFFQRFHLADVLYLFLYNDFIPIGIEGAYSIQNWILYGTGTGDSNSDEVVVPKKVQQVRTATTRNRLKSLCRSAFTMAISARHNNQPQNKQDEIY